MSQAQAVSFQCVYSVCEEFKRLKIERHTNELQLSVYVQLSTYMSEQWDHLL